MYRVLVVLGYTGVYRILVENYIYVGDSVESLVKLAARANPTKATYR